MTKRVKQTIKKASAFMLALSCMIVPARADNLSDSTVGAGVKNLLGDASTYIMIIGPSVGALAAAYFLVRRSMADEQDGKMWSRRVWIAVICGVAVLLVGGIIALISSYF